jgi:DNA repair photolyase
MFKNNFIFHFTIGSSDSNTLKYWEPGAPDFEERLASLKYAHWKGYQTSVSPEPMLDGNIVDVVEQVLPYVTETVWIGMPNQLIGRLVMNGHRDQATINSTRRLMSSLSDQYIWDLYTRYKDNPKINMEGQYQEDRGNRYPLLLATVNLETLMVMAYNIKLKDTPFSATHTLSIPTTPEIPS